MNGIDIPGLSVIHGIGQRSMYVEDFVKIYEMLKNGERNKVVYMGLRL
jgi:pyruvate ferredoxin oxidoreductase alpha subunit